MTPIIAYRCVKCGWDFTEPDVAPSTVAEVLEHWRCIDVKCEGRVERAPVYPTRPHFTATIYRKCDAHHGR